MADQDTAAVEVDDDAEDAKKIITAANSSVKELAIGVFKRFLELVIKLVGMKGIIFSLATAFFFMGKVEWYVWAGAGLFFISSRLAERFLESKIGK